MGGTEIAWGILIALSISRAALLLTPRGINPARRLLIAHVAGWIAVFAAKAVVEGYRPPITLDWEQPSAEVAVAGLSIDAADVGSAIWAATSFQALVLWFDAIRVAVRKPKRAKRRAVAATGEHIVITVHGTNDIADDLVGEKWFQRGSEFAECVKGALAARGIAAEIEPLLWSGRNSSRARSVASEALVERTWSAVERGALVHVVGHSHGGNVAAEAASEMPWRGADGQAGLISITTIGTPFFRRWMGAFEIAIRLIAVVISVVAVPTTALLALGAAVEPTPQSLGGRDIPFVYFALAALAAAMMLVVALRRWGQVRFSRGFRRSSAYVSALVHPADEAIAFLQRVDKLRIEAFQRGVLIRNASGSSVSLGLVASVACLLPVPLFLGSAEPAAALTIGALVAVSVFVSVTVITFLSLGVIPELSRGWFNGLVAQSLRRAAFGIDGHMTLGDVASAPHGLKGHVKVLDGDIADRIAREAHEASTLLLEKYRAALLAIDSGDNNSVAMLSEDAMTWRSLVHTTYFDHAEVRDWVVETLSSAIDGVKGAEARRKDG